MRIKITLLIALLFFCNLIGLSQEKSSPQKLTLAARIDKLIADSRIKQSNIGIAIYSSAKDKTLYTKNADKNFIIASNAKLFTTACALEKLGPSFTFSTYLYYSGVIYQNVLKGDLIVIGGGDPNISARFHNGNPTAIFEDWAAKLKSLGVKKIEGDIILDHTIFDDEYIPPSWKNQDLSKWYAAPVGALSLNDNCVDITVIAGDKEKEKATISVSPDTKYVTIINNTKTVKRAPKSEIGFSRKKDTNEITIWGETPIRARLTFSIAIHNPTFFFGTVLLETIKRTGVDVTGKLLSHNLWDGNCGGVPIEDMFGKECRNIDWIEYERANLLAEFKSDMLTTVTVANKVSQNFYAEMLLKFLSRKFNSQIGWGTTARGIEVINNFLSKIGISSVSLEDGSGLSRNNAASPNDIVALLKYMANGRYSKEFISSLPVSGATEGSLKSRMKSNSLKGRVFAKTGHLTGVSTLSGYINTQSGDTVIFSILVNSSAGDTLQDKICELLISL